MTISTQTSPDFIDGVYYPSSDGEPMAETDIHVLTIMHLLQALRHFLRGRSDYYATANILWYWEKGNPKARCSPDVMVIRGVEKRLRRSYRSWQENNTPPCVVFEISSEETWQYDLAGKRELYARLGAREYFVFDPEAVVLDPPLRGFRLEEGDLVEFAATADGNMICQELELRLVPEGRVLRLIELRSGERVLTPEERAEQAEAEVERLKQQLASLTQQKNGGAAPK